jgi:cellulose synthase/poly-beta-1,6-N-acetylglucosamine synthase-like glycosyltransferase
LTNRWVQSALLWTLIAMTFGSADLYVSAWDRYWVIFTFGYIGTLIVYTGYLLVLLLIHDVRPRKYPAYAGQKIGVLIPCYNEEPGSSSARSGQCSPRTATGR